MEGSSVVPVAQPDLRLFVTHPFLSPERWKPTSGPLIAQSDVVVVNRPAAETRAPSPEVLAGGLLVVGAVTIHSALALRAGADRDAAAGVVV